MRSLILVACIMAIIAITVGSAFAAYVNEETATLYGGPLKSGDIWGSGAWAEDAATSFTWYVGYNPDTQLWHYSYTVDVPKYALSHLIIEASETFTAEEFLNSSYGNVFIDDFKSGPGNPDMPYDIHGIKFDDTANAGDPFTVSFDSPREPMWGSFYAKDGSQGGSMWNSGFEDSESGKFVKVPDTVVPEPMTILGACAILGPAGFIFRKKMSK